MERGPDLDAELPAIVAGDPSAFARWVAGAEPLLRRGLRAFASEVDAEAIVQETLLRAWQVAPRIEVDGRPNGLLRFALHAARNLAIGEVRRLRVAEHARREMERRSDHEVESWRPPDPLLREHIAECRKKLPTQPGRALDARLGDGGGQPDRSLAAMLGMRLNTFLQNITRARKLLADCLRRAGIDLDGELA